MKSSITNQNIGASAQNKPKQDMPKGQLSIVKSGYRNISDQRSSNKRVKSIKNGRSFYRVRKTP